MNFTKIKTNTKVLFAGALSSLFIMASCSKYEDGPAVSLRTKKERVSNSWVVEKAYENGDDVTDQYNQYDLYMTKDGDAELNAEYTIFDTEFSVATDGTWEFTNNQENLSLDFEEDDYDAEYQILRLAEKELWLREKGEEVELHLTEK